MNELKKQPVWVNWRSEERGGKPTKVPYNPRTGKGARSNNPETWASFVAAEDAKNKNNYDGVGFMFADGICGIDIDNKTGKPELEKQAQTVIALMDTYTERSPSGTGYHIIFKCDMSRLPTTADNKLDPKYYQKNPQNGLECYFAGLTNRYFTYTGDIINDKGIEDRTEEILIFLENYMLRDNFKKTQGEPPPKRTPPHSNPREMPVPEILSKARRAKNGVKFSALFDMGDTSEHNGDDSSADQALCNMLAWWLQGDFNEIDSYFRQSALYREKWERSDYRTSTINKAIESCGGEYYKGPGRPKKKNSAPRIDPDGRVITDSESKFDKLTIAGVEEYLQQIGVTSRYNETTRKVNITGLNDYNSYYIADSLPIIIYDKLNLLYKKCPKGDVQDFLKVITMNSAYNPVLELIDSGKWDGTDRLPELFRIIHIGEADRLSKILIYKWLWQNLSMLRNFRGDFGADGLLVLKGGQAIGKTTFARKMALQSDFFGEGLLLDIRDKDTVIRAVSCWIGELGEIESTFKSDINALKAFISRATDKYRVPYGRIDDEIPRRTSFIGTCNSDEYLIDETGNRRYWTVPINERMDLDALEKFDAFQLYLQINERAKDDIQGFRLTPEENKQLAERNSLHEKPLKAEWEVRDILFIGEREHKNFEEMTITEFKDSWGVLRNYAVKDIGIAINKIGIKPELKKKDGRTQKIYKLPRSQIRLDISDFKN